MSELPFSSGRVFRARLSFRTLVIGVPAVAIVSTYLIALLNLTADQWNEFFWAVGVLMVFFIVGGTAVQRRMDVDIARAIDAEAEGRATPEMHAAAFEQVMALPARTFVSSGSPWILSGVVIALWMSLRLEDLPRMSAVVIALAATNGGLVSSTFVFFVVKQFLAPLRNALAERAGGPDARAGLVSSVPMMVKIGVPLASVVLATVSFTVLLSYTRAVRPVEHLATRIQEAYLARIAHRIDGPGDPAIELARIDSRELGSASEILLVDVEEGEVLDGPADLLTPTEMGWITAETGSLGTSLGVDSPASFAWMRLEHEPDLALVAYTHGDELTGALAGMGWAFGLLFAVASGVALLASWLLARDVAGATARLRVQAERVADGDLTAREVLESDDELGELGRAFERMVVSLRAMVGRVAETADRVESAALDMTEVGTGVASATSDQVQGIEQATGSMASINRQVAGITESAQVLNGNVEEASSSVLELGAAGEELNQTAQALNTQIEEVSSSIEQMIRSVRQIAENTEGLAQAVGETSSSMAEMATSMEQVDANAAETARLSARVVELADGGREKVRETISGMDAIREATDTARDVIRSLGGRVQEIGAIVDVIDDVADETNLLALNAAIIAAQAGDQGRAFSVVADEIKDLADRVLSSTKEIGDLIRSVQGESSNANVAIERGSQSVQSGVDLSAEAGISLEEITSAARDSGERIKEIVVAVREQAKAASHVNALMERVAGRVEEIRQAGREQERGNEIVMRGSVVMRDVAQQTQRTTEEQSHGAMRIRDSMESVRDAVDRIHAALQEQTEACRAAVSFLEQVYERTRSNDEASRRMAESTRGLRENAEALRADVRRFRL